MGQYSKIGWTDHTQNFWWGCNKVSEECRHCYIASIMRRGGYEPFAGPIRTKNWNNPYRWNRVAESDQQRLRIFTCSMSDFFHPSADPWRNEAWEVIRDCEWLDWLILTKRPELIWDRLPADWGSGYENVWLGVTAGCKKSLSRVEELVQIPAAIRFVSAEPLLEKVNFRPYLSDLNWVITGCERAKKGVRRLMDLDWVRQIQADCDDAMVPHFFKQYYQNDVGIPVEDGLLDGKVQQQWPRNRHPLQLTH
ncbi:DUF5131 family protein [uncultured Rubinisphaera sp.]|uniref:DUF5131 family protein n=1 Tax=uncultured Rubinisphaera sp. TaxID=1678686 RepID=UPI0030D8A38D